MAQPIPEACALTESALEAVFMALESARNPEDFLAQADAIIGSPENLLALPNSLGPPDPLSASGTRAVDIDNAAKVHEYIGEMDSANAADGRLWTYLAVSSYRDYMTSRWPLASEPDSDSWKRRARDRWLLHNGAVTRGKLIRHGIARLWWVAHLTYAPEATSGIAKDDPYAYTREVFKSEDRLNAIFDREVGAFPEVATAILDHAAELGENATDKYLQRIMQYLTLVHGYQDIGAMPKGSVAMLVGGAAQRLASE